MRFVICSVVYSVRRGSLLGTGRGAPFRRFISYFYPPLVPRRPCARSSRTARRRNRSSSSIVLRRRGSRGSYSGIQRGGAPLLPGEEDGPADFRDHDHRQRVADEQQQGPAFLERSAVVHKRQSIMVLKKRGVKMERKVGQVFGLGEGKGGAVCAVAPPSAPRQSPPAKSRGGGGCGIIIIIIIISSSSSSWDCP